MKQIGELIDKTKPEPKRGGINSEFNYAVGQAIAFMGEDHSKDKRTFGKWCGRLRGMSPGKIYELMSQAKEGRNPQALFNHLLKQWKLKQKTKARNSSPQSAPAADKRQTTPSHSTEARR